MGRAFPCGFLVLALVACGGRSTSAKSASAEGSECAASGGTCVLQPGVACATPAPSSAQDCDAPGPGGQMCCLSTYGEQTCAERTSEAQTQTIAAMLQAEQNLTCATDADCVLASNSSACWGSCGVPLNQAGAAQLQAAIAQINAAVCATFAADGCVAERTPCAGGGAHCIAGKCGEYVVLPADAGH